MAELDTVPTDPALDNLEGDDRIVAEAHKRFKYCVEFESLWRTRADEDERFYEADSNNMYQWESRLLQERRRDNRPSLTNNRIRQHCLQIINDAKQNKPGVNIRPTGGGATFQAAQTFQSVVRHIEYRSGAETVYDSGTEKQVIRGLGYWRIITEFPNPKTFDQEIKIAKVKDARGVYLDPDITEKDGSDARFGFVFDDLAKDRYRELYPKEKGALRRAALGNLSDPSWLRKDHIRVADYYRKEAIQDELVNIVTSDGNEKPVLRSATDPKTLKQAIASMAARGIHVQRRTVTRYQITHYKIAGEKIIGRTPWLGMYVPIVRVLGEEYMIDGTMDRKGHVRALKDPQRIYNYWTSSFVEYGALQSKTPYVAAAEAISGYEDFWNTANLTNYSVLPYRGIDQKGNQIQMPQRQAAPMSSEAAVAGMGIAQQEMMMNSGQYEANFGQKGNERSGVAINERQRQGDNATYHYIDGLAIAIRFTGKILVDLIPKIYDVPRVIRIKADDGEEKDIQVDPSAREPYKESPQEEEETASIIFNPNIGEYAVIADMGPAYATKRQEAFNALTQIIGNNPQMMSIFGDLYFSTSDFPMAAELAARARKLIPPHILGDAPTPEQEQMVQMIQQLQETVKGLVQKGAEEQLTSMRKDVERQMEDMEIRIKKYEAETHRLAALHDSLPMDANGLQKLIEQSVGAAIADQLKTSPRGSNGSAGVSEGAA